MRPDSRDTALLHELIEQLQLAAGPVEFGRAIAPTQKRAIFAQRCETVIARGWASPDQFPDGLEHDGHEAQAIHIEGRWDASLVASARIVLPKAGRMLPIEVSHDLRFEPIGQYVEVGRTIVRRASGLRHAHLFAALIGHCLNEILQCGYFRIAAGATRSMLRLYRRLGWSALTHGPPRCVWGEERFPVSIEVMPSARRMLRSLRSPRAG